MDKRDSSLHDALDDDVLFGAIRLRPSWPKTVMEQKTAITRCGSMLAA